MFGSVALHLFDYGHILVSRVNDRFIFAFRAKKREMFEYRFRQKFQAYFAVTFRTQYPFVIVHFITTLFLLVSLLVLLLLLLVTPDLL